MNIPEKIRNQMKTLYSSAYYVVSFGKASSLGEESFVRREEKQVVEIKKTSTHTKGLIESEAMSLGIQTIGMNTVGKGSSGSVKKGESVIGQKSSLHDLIRSGNIVGLKSLIKKGVELELRDEQGQTPLILASSLGDLEMVKLLLKSQAAVNTVDDYQYTALMVAVQNNDEKIVEVLLKMERI